MDEPFFDVVQHVSDTSLSLCHVGGRDDLAAISANVSDITACYAQKPQYRLIRMSATHGCDERQAVPNGRSVAWGIYCDILDDPEFHIGFEFDRAAALFTWSDITQEPQAPRLIRSMSMIEAFLAFEANVRMIPRLRTACYMQWIERSARNGKSFRQFALDLKPLEQRLSRHERDELRKFARAALR